MAKREALDKSFDDPEVRRLMGAVTLERLWSKEADVPLKLAKRGAWAVGRKAS